MPPEQPTRNGYIRWPGAIVALIASFVAILSFILTQENKFVHTEQYRVDQARTEKQLDRMEEKLDRIDKQLRSPK